MDDLPTDELFAELRSRDPRDAWVRFLQHYSPLLFDVVRRFERDAEHAADCYLFVCEQLSANGFRRLLHFKAGGTASLSTWLRAVARNLCLDWHRHEFGRHRVFESVARLPALDQEVFRALFVDRLPVEDLFQTLAPRHPGLTVSQVAERARVVEQGLSSRQRWLLAVRAARGAPNATVATENDAAAILRIPSELPNPETSAGLQEERAALLKALGRLPVAERLLVKLRFDRELTLAEVARVMGFENAQAADRRIRDVVQRLKEELAAARPGRR